MRRLIRPAAFTGISAAAIVGFVVAGRLSTERLKLNDVGGWLDRADPVDALAEIFGDAEDVALPLHKGDVGAAGKQERDPPVAQVFEQCQRAPHRPGRGVIEAARDSPLPFC